MPTKKMHKRPMAAPADMIAFRADTDNPGLADRFHELLKLHTGDRAAVMRALVVAWCECVEREQRPPMLPLYVESLATKKKK